jgi:hypothetical protein
MTELPEISDNSESGSGTSSDGPDTGSFTQAIGPLFAAFSLPTIAQLIGQRPIPWPSVALFTAGTGFLVAGYQFSINNALPETQGPRKLRALLTYVGMAGIGGGLSLLVGSTKRDYRWWPLCVLWVGFGLPFLLRVCLRDFRPVIVKLKDRGIQGANTGAGRAAHESDGSGRLRNWWNRPVERQVVLLTQPQTAILTQMLSILQSALQDNDVDRRPDAQHEPSAG